MHDGSGRTSRPRTPGIVQGGVVAALLIVLASLTITASTTPPPAIAEFAPDAVTQIKEAPPEQSSDVGTAPGGGNRGEAASPSPSAAPSASPSTGPGDPPPSVAVRRCVGNPPRQTEDPQSPPCVAFWQGDNGGATSKGVTRDTIRVNISNLSPRVASVLEAYFNKRFELYGRKFDITLDNPYAGTCDRNKAAAQEVDQTKVFATGTKDGSDLVCYYTELARRKMIVTTTQNHFTEADMARFRPFMWQYSMSNDKMFALMGEAACARLAGKNAVYAGDPGMQARKRVFGAILQYDDRDVPIGVGSLERALAQCGEKLAAYVDYGPALDAATAQQTMIRMQNAGVTTVFCLCIIFVEQNLPPAANAQAYYPEWFFSSYGGNDGNFALKTFWTEPVQCRTVLGIGVNPRAVALEDQPWWQAAREADPTFSENEIGNLMLGYRDMLLLASGVQMAGPNLTPQTFEAALHRTVFPNPQTPLNAGRVGFNDGDHSMTDDGTEFFWRESARDPSPPQRNSVGALCWVDGGRRWSPGQWPRAEPKFFQPAEPAPCDSGG